jgi:7,8-dihydroneopterin aldolase/epimerase/oxygenase
MLRGVVGLEGYRVRCIIGVHEAERREERELLVDLKIACDWSSCVRSDLVKDAVDYENLARICSELARERKFRLLESYAHEVLCRLAELYPLLWASIRIRKPGALANLDASFVELSFSREEG